MDKRAVCLHHGDDLAGDHYVAQQLCMFAVCVPLAYLVKGESDHQRSQAHAAGNNHACRKSANESIVWPQGKEEECPKRRSQGNGSGQGNNEESLHVQCPIQCIAGSLLYIASDAFSDLCCW